MKNYLAKKMDAVKSGLNNNKGFSLVELIIVIAIMAVLMGVLAPQFIKYVEQSREATDLQALNGLVTSIKTSSVEQKVYDQIAAAGATGVTVVWTGTDGAVTGTATDLVTALGTVGMNSTGAASSAAGKASVITFTVYMDTATSTVKYKVANSNTAHADWVTSELASSFNLEAG